MTLERVRRIFSPSLERLTRYDAQGRILQDGVQWETYRDIVFAASILLVGGGAALLGLVLAGLAFPGRAVSGALNAFAVLAVGAALFRFRFKRHAVIFTDKGEILTPYGFPGYPLRKSITGNHADIDLIELRVNDDLLKQNMKRYGVVLYGADGSIVSVASPYYHHDHAYRIARQLNHALYQFR